MVRSGETLFALDEKDGRELWSMKGLDLGGSGERGKNLREIPDTPLLLVKRDEPRRSDAFGTLLGVNFRNGKILWRGPGIRTIFEVIPFLERERVLLVTGPDLNRGLLFRPRLQLLHMFEGNQVEWRSKLALQTGLGGPSLGFLFSVIDRRLYVHYGSEIARIDLGTGKRTWRYSGGFSAPPLRSSDGKILVAGKGVFALDPVSGQPVWTVKNLRKIRHWVLGQGVVFGIGGKGAFALDSATGAMRWAVERKGRATNPILFEESNYLVFGGKAGLVVLDAASGKIVRSIGLNLKSEPSLIRKVGRNFMLCADIRLKRTGGLAYYIALGMSALGMPHSPWMASGSRGLFKARMELSLCDLTTGTKLWTEKDVRTAFAAVRSPDTAAFATKLAKNEWELYRIDPRAGQRKEWILAGSQPDFSTGIGLAYAVTGDTSRAFRLSGDS